MGYLYVIRSQKNSDFYKIGITTNWSNRSKQLYVNKKTTLYLLFVLSDDAEKVAEKSLHKYFKNDRLPQSEWFCIENNQELEKVCNTIAVEQFGASVEFVEPEKDDKHNTDGPKIYQEDSPCDFIESFESELREAEADDWSGEGEETFFMNAAENPFLHSFEAEACSETGPRIYIQYIQPDNILAEVAFGFDFCKKKKCLQLVFLGSYIFDCIVGHNWLDGEEDWFRRQYPGFCENTVNLEIDYLFEFYALLSPLTQIPEPKWPYIVRNRIFEQESQMRRLVKRGLL